MLLKNKISTHEISILLLSWGFYGLIGFTITSTTFLSLHPDYIHDLYLGFDNTYQNTSAVRHPLLKILSLFLNKILKFSNHPDLFLIGICSTLLSIQNLFIYKYLTNIISLRKIEAICILILYMGFSSNLILSFTFESYTFSTCFISIYLFFNAYLQKQKQEISPIFFYSFFSIISGITITNGFKILLTSYKKISKIFLKHFIIIFIIGCSICFAFFYDSIINSIIHSSQFLKSGEHYGYDIFYLFLGGSIIFPDLEIQNLYYENAKYIKTISAVYPNIFSIKTLIITNLLTIITISVIKNFKNQYVQTLIIFFCVDIFIHCILKLGLNEAQIFGGNFIGIYPLFIGFLVKNSPYNKVIIYNLFIITLLVYFYNFYNLLYIWEFGKTFYPK